MYPRVQSEFTAFTTKFEGRVEYMYQDILGLVTIGIGNLIDPISLALPLPFVFKNNPDVLASQADIINEWNLIKSHTELAQLGHRAAAPLTNLKLNEADIDNLIIGKLLQNEAMLKSGTPEFTSFDQLPADAQLGLLSMAWAAGPAFAQAGRFPSFRQAVANGNWDKAAEESRMNDTNNPGLRPRNRANKILFANAARVIEQNLPFDVLHYPAVLTPGLEKSPVVSEGWPLLQEGSTRPAVTALQHLLREQGLQVDTNGIFDAATTIAVKAFQTNQGLGADGIVGRNTWSALAVLRRLNDSGEAVQAIQDRLFFWDAGLVFNNPGVFDQLTDQKVREVQASFNLVIDGIVGPATWKTLLAL